MKCIFHQYFWNLFINGILNSYLIPINIRVLFLNILGAKIEGSFHPKSIILSHRLKMGHHSFINRHCLIDNGKEWITIGNNVAIACNVSLLTTNHSYEDESRRGGQVIPKPGIIEDGAWIGANCIILPGTKITKGCVIAAGSVVKGETEPNSIYAGNPAKIIKKLV